MRGFKVTEKALADLKEIARYTQNRWGRDQRIKYLAQLDSLFARLVNDPRPGVCPRIDPEVKIRAFETRF